MNLNWNIQDWYKANVDENESFTYFSIMNVLQKLNVTMA
jgi:hypothetical protein